MTALREVTAELSATVWKVLVRAGQQVHAGDELAILESMKMEIPVLSPCSGTVAQMLAAEGSQVDEGEVIVLIQEEGQEG